MSSIGSDKDGIVDKINRNVAVANAFVDVVSARAYRSSMTFGQAGRALMTGTSTAFDTRPASALLDYLDIKGGR